MKFLTKLGQIILRATEIVTGFAPTLAALDQKDSAAIQVVSQDLAQVAQIVAQVEVFGQALSLPGAQKLTAAAPAVAQIILKSSILVGHTINDQALFAQGTKKIADGMADVLNSLHDNIQTQSKT